MLENDTYEIWNEYHRTLVDMYIPNKNDDTLKGKYDKCNLKIFNNETNSNLTKCSECSEGI
jgi:hypothetical protein